MITVIVYSGIKLNNNLPTKLNKSETKRYFKLASSSYNFYIISKTYPEIRFVIGSLIATKTKHLLS
jgi:hypothetical protein